MQVKAEKIKLPGMDIKQITVTVTDPLEIIELILSLRDRILNIKRYMQTDDTGYWQPALDKADSMLAQLRSVIYDD